MYARRNTGVIEMTNNDNDVVLVTERFERRLAEDNGKTRVEMAKGFGTLRAEMIDRNQELLKWLLIFACAHLAATAALLTLLQ
jgi:Ribonuclease G/E